MLDKCSRSLKYVKRYVVKIEKGIRGQILVPSSFGESLISPEKVSTDAKFKNIFGEAKGSTGC